MGWEKYSPLLARDINTIDKLFAAADAYAVLNNISVDSIAYWDHVSEIIQRSFSHGYSYYDLSENWVAAVAGKIIWRDLAAIVDPEHIIHYPNAACSQQAIVLMACLKKKNIPFRPVLFPQHYAAEAMIAGRWRFFDDNLEPSLPENTHALSLMEYSASGSLPKIYSGILTDSVRNYMMGSVRYGAISATPAARMILLHKMTRVFSWTLWLIPGYFGIMTLIRLQRRKRRNAIRIFLLKPRSGRGTRIVPPGSPAMGRAVSHF